MVAAGQPVADIAAGPFQFAAHLRQARLVVGGQIQVLDGDAAGYLQVVSSERVTQQCSIDSAGEREVTTQQLGELVMRELKKLDKVAYIRFASVYRNFEDVDAFSRAIREVSPTPRKK